MSVVVQSQLFFFFNDTATTEIYTLSLHDALPISAFYTARISLRQRPRPLYCPFLVAAAPQLFILTISRCASAAAFYTAPFLLWQRPRFLYCPFLVAAAPSLFILTGSTMNFFLPGSPCEIGRAHV